jgi:hypothetical protein
MWIADGSCCAGQEITRLENNIYRLVTFEVLKTLCYPVVR